MATGEDVDKLVVAMRDVVCALPSGRAQARESLDTVVDRLGKPGVNWVVDCTLLPEYKVTVLGLVLGAHMCFGTVLESLRAGVVRGGGPEASNALWVWFHLLVAIVSGFEKVTRGSEGCDSDREIYVWMESQLADVAATASLMDVTYGRGECWGVNVTRWYCWSQGMETSKFSRWSLESIHFRKLHMTFLKSAVLDMDSRIVVLVGYLKNASYKHLEHAEELYHTDYAARQNAFSRILDITWCLGLHTRAKFDAKAASVFRIVMKKLEFYDDDDKLSAIHVVEGLVAGYLECCVSNTYIDGDDHDCEDDSDDDDDHDSEEDSDDDDDLEMSSVLLSYMKMVPVASEAVLWPLVRSSAAMKTLRNFWTEMFEEIWIEENFRMVWNAGAVAKMTNRPGRWSSGIMPTLLGEWQQKMWSALQTYDHKYQEPVVYLLYKAAKVTGRTADVLTMSESLRQKKYLTWGDYREEIKGLSFAAVKTFCEAAQDRWSPCRSVWITAVYKATTWRGLRGTFVDMHGSEGGISTKRRKGVAAEK
jgi:hypothetical protein